MVSACGNRSEMMLVCRSERGNALAKLCWQLCTALCIA
jgi:hypothetical protein